MPSTWGLVPQRVYHLVGTADTFIDKQGALGPQGAVRAQRVAQPADRGCRE